MSLRAQLDIETTWGELRKFVALGAHLPDDAPVDVWDVPMCGDFGGFEVAISEASNRGS